MNIRNIFRSVAAELGFRNIGKTDGDTVVITPETTLASISRNSNGRYVLRLGKSVVSDYASRAGAVRGAARRGLSLQG